MKTAIERQPIDHHCSGIRMRFPWANVADENLARHGSCSWEEWAWQISLDEVEQDVALERGGLWARILISQVYKHGPGGLSVLVGEVAHLILDQPMSVLGQVRMRRVRLTLTLSDDSS